MGISDRIEMFINELLKDEENDWVEIKRNELASVFNCVPSQITYVISTRFSPNNGYAIESRRGGGGYLRIRRLSADSDNPILGVLRNIPSAVSYTQAKGCIDGLIRCGAADDKTGAVILAALSDSALTITQPVKDVIRANILKNTLSAIAAEQNKNIKKEDDKNAIR